ncbi:MAG: tetratricopeptide repeat protein [Myxococcales bacterium]|nr:tetratricopeptide repeat protein [Myxococcales bacterium]
MVLVLLAACAGPVEPQRARPNANAGEQPIAPRAQTSESSRDAAVTQAAPTTDTAEVANERGKMLLLEGRYAEASAEFERAYQLDPSLVKVSVNLATSLFQEGKFGPALAIARRAFEMQNATLQQKRVLAKVAGASTEECAKQKLECSILDDAEVTRSDARGQALLDKQQLDDAELVFLTTYAFSGKPRPLLRVARFEYLRKEYRTALEHAESARARLKASPKLFQEADVLVKTIEKECAEQKIRCR